jgi:hypothetical protein
MGTFDLPDTFDVANLNHLATLIDHLRMARVKHFEHPSGLKLDLETRAVEKAPEKPAGDEF